MHFVSLVKTVRGRTACVFAVRPRARGQTCMHAIRPRMSVVSQQGAECIF